MTDIGELHLLETLLLLLPGFVTAEIIGALVVRGERKTLDRIVQALIYTFLAHMLWAPIRKLVGDDLTINLIGVGASAMVWGMIFTLTIGSINTGRLHRVRHRLHLTRVASRQVEWFDAFYGKQQHVILHLDDGRRIFGWPRLYPSQSDEGHILLEGAEWLTLTEREEPKCRGDYLINVTEVRFVEFLPPKELEKQDA